MSEAAVPRTRENRLSRPPPWEEWWEVGDLTCPRCGWPCKYLIKPYHESVWSAHGGMCGPCCQQAAGYYDAKSAWPPPETQGTYGTITWTVPEGDSGEW